MGLRSPKGIGIAYQGKVVHVNEPIPLAVRVVDNSRPGRGPRPESAKVGPESAKVGPESVCQASTKKKADLDMTDNDTLRGQVSQLQAENKTLKDALRVRSVGLSIDGRNSATYSPMSFRGSTASGDPWGPGPMAYVPRGFSLPKSTSGEVKSWSDPTSRDTESLKIGGVDHLPPSESAECIVSLPSRDVVEVEAAAENESVSDSKEPGQALQVSLEEIQEMAQRAREAQLAAQLAQEQAELAKEAARQALETAQRQQAELAKERQALEAAQREADLAMERQALEAAQREQAELAKEREALEAAQREADLAMERQALEAAQREQAELAKERQAIEAAQQRRWAPSGLTRSVGAQPPTQKPPRTFDGRFRKPPPPRREPPRAPASASSTRGTPQTVHTEAYTRRTVEKLLDVLIERTHADDAVLRQLQASALLQFTQSQKTAFQATTAQRTAPESESVNWPRAVMSIAMALEKHLAAGRTV